MTSVATQILIEGILQMTESMRQEPSAWAASQACLMAGKMGEQRPELKGGFSKAIAVVNYFS